MIRSNDSVPQVRFVAVCLVTGAVACTPATKPDAATTSVVSETKSVASETIPTPEELTFRSGPLNLHAFLFRPPGAGRFPAIVFNHGSEEFPGAKQGQAEFFVPHGFVLFVPHRRGHGRSKDAGR